MKKNFLSIVQTLGFRLYFIANKSGLFRYKFAENAFIKSYYLYKSKLENLDLALIGAYVKPNSAIIDVGANIGWFTVNISPCLQTGSSIIAVEPGQTNIRRLRSAINKFNLQDKVQILQCALSDTRGTGFLTLDAKNPANHQVGERDSYSEEIELKLLDDLTQNIESVCLIKIDVQGHELSVLRGSINTLKTFSPTILMEIDNTKDSSASSDLWIFLNNFSYLCIDPVTRNPISLEQIVNLKGYRDLLFSPGNSRK